jgi:hypothetical protein
MEMPMLLSESVVAVFGEDRQAQEAVKKLETGGFPKERLSVIGKRYQTGEKVEGFYTIGDRMKFWGRRGAFWGALWGLFLGGVSLTIPAVGPVMVLGYLAAIVVSAVEGAIMIGGLSALGAALYSIGVPRGTIVTYEQAVKADGFLVIVHGALGDLKRASAILAPGKPARLDLFNGSTADKAGFPYRGGSAASLRRREQAFHARYLPNL